MEPVFQITLAGGGNLCHASAAVIGHMNPKFRINILSRRPEVWKPEITAFTAKSHWQNKGNMVGKINKVSSQAKDVIPGSHIVLICSPAHTKGEILKQVRNYLEPGCLIGSIFGQGAFDWQAQAALGGVERMAEMKWTIFCLQYVPFICKAVKYGESVNIIGPKKHLYVTSFPLENIHYVCNAMTNCYFIPCIPIPGFLNLTLCPSNQIIHPGRVYSIFKDWDGESTREASSMPLLYEDLDQASADEIQFLDDEIQKIRASLTSRFPNLNLSQILPIKERICAMYEGQVTDTSSLKRIFNTNLGYSRVPFPMVPKDAKEPNKVVLNKQARFFWEDVPFGLCILKDIGRICGVDVPNLTKQIVFHQKFMPFNFVDPATGEFIPEALSKTGAPSAYGIQTMEQLVATSMSQQKQHMDKDVFFQNKPDQCKDCQTAKL